MKGMGCEKLKEKSHTKTDNFRTEKLQEIKDEPVKVEIRDEEQIHGRGPGNDDDASEKKENGQDLDELSAQLDALKQKADEERDRLLRVLAEFENYKKRMNRHMEEYKKYANEGLLKDLLSVVDNLERAISSSSNAMDNPKESCVVEGVEMTLNEILKIMEKFHVTSFEAQGKPFDPAFHEAVMQQESEKYPENTVINVLQKGYLIHDRLLRPAMVIVSKGKTNTN